MRLFALLALLPAVFAAPTKRQSLYTVSEAENDVGAIHQAVLSSTAAIEAYQGGVVQSAPILATFGDIHLVNRKAYLDAMAPGNFNSTESRDVVQYTENTVGESIPAAVQALEAKKPQLAAAGESSGVVQGLELLKSDHETFSEELLQKVSPDLLARAQAVVLKIDNAIQNGIDDFAGFTS